MRCYKGTVLSVDKHDGVYEYLVEDVNKTHKCKIVLWDHEFNLNLNYDVENEDYWFDNDSGHKVYYFEDYPVNAYCDGEGGVDGYTQYIERYVKLYEL